MAEDIPKTMIVVLLVLTVIISIASTWVVLDNTMNAKVGYTASMDKDETGGRVNIGVGTGGEESLGAAPALITGEAVTNIALKIN